jgi:hypothetical protein
VSTARQIEQAILALDQSERDKLRQHLPQLFPELRGDANWEQIISHDRPRPSLSALLDSYEARLTAEPDSYPKVAESDFD